MKYLILILTLNSCVLFEPAKEIVEKGAKPLTVFSAVWIMAEMVNPIAAGILASAFTAFWDSASEEEAKEEAQQMTKDVVATMIDGQTDRLAKEGENYNTFQNWLFFGFVGFWVLRHYRDIKRFVKRIAGRI